MCMCMCCVYTCVLYVHVHVLTLVHVCVCMRTCECTCTSVCSFTLWCTFVSVVYCCTVECFQGGAQSCGDEHQVQDTGDPPVHHGCQAGPEDHQPPGHLQEGVQNT